MTKPYRPWSGTAGDIFQDAFCVRCKHDNFNEGTGEGGCPIIVAAMCFEINDPRYPKEWVKDDDDKHDETARCTKFEGRP